MNRLDRWMVRLGGTALLAATIVTVPTWAAAELAIQKSRIIQTTPFPNSTLSVLDNEGLAYVAVNNTIWIADDGANRIWEVNKDSGFMLSFITRSTFEDAVRLGGTEIAGTERTGDFEALAYDAANDILYLISGSCCPKPPTIFRLTRPSPSAAFTVESWQPLPADLDPSGAAWHPTGGLYLTHKSDVRPYDYVTNTLGGPVPIEKRPTGSIHGMGFTADGSKLWVVKSRDEVYRIDWATKLIDQDHVFDLLDHNITDSRGVEFINGQLYVGDGGPLADGDPNKFAVTVFDIVVSGAPPAPTGLTAAAGPQRIDLAWTDNGANETGFELQRCPGTCLSNGAFATIANVGANQTTYVDSNGTTGAGQGPVDGQTYSYRVRAVNAGGHSAFSNIETITAGPPAAPSNVGAVAISSGRIDLTWTDNSFNETGFRIERCNGAAASCMPTSFAPVGTVGADIRTYSDTGLTAVTTYTYRVRAFNNAGDSEPSAVATATTLESNLVDNAGFELDANNDGAPDVWGKTSKFRRSSEVVHGGSFAGRFFATADPAGIVTKQSVAGITAGIPYEFSGCVNIPSTTTGVEFFWELKWRNAVGDNIQTVRIRTYTAPTGGLWDCTTTPGLVAPANTASVDIRIGVTPGTYTIYVDDLVFRP